MRTIRKKGNAKIRAAMRENEQYIMALIERNGSFRPMPESCTLAIYNAIERLKKSGKIRFDRYRSAYVLSK